ncbi:hypothetical protein ABPG72_014367 [Tetrahymena utriculariae]
MDSINISINKKLGKDKDFQFLVLNMLIIRKLMNLDNDITQKYIKCYQTPRDERELTEKYVANVEQCLLTHSKQFDFTKNKMEEVIKNIEQAKDNYRSRDINCFNLVGESELKNCKEVEKRNYLLKIKSIYEQLPELNISNKF